MLQRTAVVTGCGSGMGYETARYLAKKGLKVYALTRHVEALAHLKASGVIPIKVDLRHTKSIQEALKDITRIDVLVNNAGYGYVSSVEEANEAHMREQFDINVLGVLRMCQVAIPRMRKSGGVIVNISSVLGKMGLPLLTFYNATKYAVEGITDSLRHELRPFGIRVHAILPGFFATEFARKHLIVNEALRDNTSVYAPLAGALLPQLLDEINGGHHAVEVAQAVWRIVTDPTVPARISVGEKAARFIPMRRELDDEAFEMRVRRYYGLE